MVNSKQKSVEAVLPRLSSLSNCCCFRRMPLWLFGHLPGTERIVDGLFNERRQVMGRTCKTAQHGQGNQAMEGTPEQKDFRVDLLDRSSLLFQEVLDHNRSSLSDLRSLCPGLYDPEGHTI